MSGIEFNKETQAALVRSIQLYFNEELDQQIGQFDAQFLLEFFIEKVGPYFYNQGLYDARAVLEARWEMFDEAIFEIEKPTELER